MANQLNEFDKLIKESMENYEAPYDHSHWEELEDELNVSAPGITSYFGAVTTGMVLTSVVFIGMLLFNSIYFSGTESEKLPEADQITGIDQSGGSDKGFLNDATEDSVQNPIISEGDSQLEPELTEVEKTNSLSENQNSNSKKNINTKELSSLSSPENDKDSESTVEALSNKNSEIEVSDDESSPKMRTGCTGMTIDFNASEEYGKDAHFLWNFGDGYFSNEANPSHTFSKEGVFDVSLSVTTPVSGQITSNIVQAMIEVVEAPIANLEFSISSPEVLMISNKSYNAAEIQWKLDGEIVSAKPEVSVSLADNTHHKLSLIAYNEGGCSDTLDATVNSIIAGSEFPKAFETSYRSTFAPGAIIDDGIVTSLKVYEKSTKKLVFEGSGNKGWEGKNPDGTDAKTGQYQWVMVIDKNDAIDIYQGEVQLR